MHDSSQAGQAGTATLSRHERARERIDALRARREQHPGWIIRLLRAIIVVTGVLVTLLMFFQIIIRYLFGFSIYGLEEAMSFFAVWMYFMGSVHGTWDRGHISANLINVLLKPGWAQQSLRVLACLLSVIISAWATVWAWQYLMNSIHRRLSSLEVGISMAWVNAAMPLGLGLMTVYFLVELVEEWQVLRGRT